MNIKEVPIMFIKSKKYININCVKSYLSIAKFLSFGFLKILQILLKTKAKYPLKMKVINDISKKLITLFSCFTLYKNFDTIINEQKQKEHENIINFGIVYFTWIIIVCKSLLKTYIKKGIEEIHSFFINFFIILRSLVKIVTFVSSFFISSTFNKKQLIIKFKKKSFIFVILLSLF